MDVATGDALDLELSGQPETALLFEVVDAISGAALSEIEVRADCAPLAPLTDADGRARGSPRQVRVLLPRECESFELRISARDHESLVLRGRALQEEELDLGLVRLEPVPALRLLVLSADSGEPVEDVMLELVPLPDPPGEAATIMGDAPWNRALSDGEGRARLNGLRAGAAVVVARHPDFSPLRSEPVHFIGSGERALTLRLRAGACVEVEIVDERGAPAPSVWIHHASQDQAPLGVTVSLAARSGRDGRLRFEQLAPGLHRFFAMDMTSPGGGAEASAEITVLEGGRHSLRLTVAGMGG